MSAPSSRRSSTDAGLVIVDAWAEAPAGAGPGPVADYLELVTEVDPGDDAVVLPPLVTVVAQLPPADRPAPRGSVTWTR